MLSKSGAVRPQAGADKLARQAPRFASPWPPIRWSATSPSRRYGHDPRCKQIPAHVFDLERVGAGRHVRHVERLAEEIRV